MTRPVDVQDPTSPESRTVRQVHEAGVYDERARLLYERATDEALVLDPSTPPFANREHVDFLTFALEKAAPLAGRRILETGCGSGALSVYLGLVGAEVVGVDVSAEMLAVARRRAAANGVGDRVQFLATPIEEVADPDGSFDVVIGNQVLHHFYLERAMVNIRRLLSPGGVAVFCEPVLFLPEVFRRVRNSRACTRVFPSRVDTPDERSLGIAEIELIRSFFAGSEMRPFQVTTRLQNFVELSDPWFARLSKVDGLLLRSDVLQRLCRYVVLVLPGGAVPGDEARGTGRL